MKRYLRCRWAIHEETIRRLERLKRRHGLSMQRLVNDILDDTLCDRPVQHQCVGGSGRRTPI